MMLHVVTMIMVLFTGVSLSADPQFSLPVLNDNTDAQGLKTIKIKGIAKYKPGGSKLLLSLLVEGQPGIMPGASAPGIQPTGSPGTLPPTSPGAGMSPAPPGAGMSPAPPGAGMSPAPSGSNPTSGTTVPSGSQTPSSGAISPTPSPTSGSSSGSFQPFETAALDEHNKFRAVHGSQPMKLNREMCDEAAAYAKIIARQGGLQHSTKEDRNGQGENLSYGCSSSKGQTTTEATQNWYNEVCTPGYEFSVGRGQGGTGHFTQVVWNDSVELGIGKADVKEGRLKCTYIVGRYKPLGNFFTYNEDYKKNVKKGSFNRQAYCSSVKSSYKKSFAFVSKVL